MLKNIAYKVFLAAFAVIYVVSAYEKENNTGHPGWPRIINIGDNELILYQPQIDNWNNFKNIEGMAVFEIRNSGAGSFFGSVNFTAAANVDLKHRKVLLYNKVLSSITPDENRFPDDISKDLIKSVYSSPETISLDRVIAGLELNVKNNTENFTVVPPAIIYRNTPAILVITDGKPVYDAINGTSLSFAVNTNWDLFYDNNDHSYYLLNGNYWMKSSSQEDGWKPVTKLPDDFDKLPDNGNWINAKKNIPPSQFKGDNVPEVIFSSEPTELVFTDGDPLFSPVPGTKLMFVENSNSNLLYYGKEKKFYLLISGRWYTAEKPDGPWPIVNNGLPEDFRNISETSRYAYILSSVPGTRPAAEAAFLSQIPAVADIDVNKAGLEVAYDGEPKFEKIEGTKISYAVNSPDPIIITDDNYYCCHNAVWFVSSYPYGPWEIAEVVPAEISSIPSGNPFYYLRYVKVNGKDGSRVSFACYPGYKGIFTESGIPVLGTGHLYRPYINTTVNPPVYFSRNKSFGMNAYYDYFSGGFVNKAKCYGPHGGIGITSVFDIRRGEYKRGESLLRTGCRNNKDHDKTSCREKHSKHPSDIYSVWSCEIVKRNPGWRSSDYYSGPGGEKYIYHYASANDSTKAGDYDNNVFAGKDGSLYKNKGSEWLKWDGLAWVNTGMKPYDGNGKNPGQTEEPGEKLPDQLNYDLAARSRGNFLAEEYYKRFGN